MNPMPGDRVMVFDNRLYVDDIQTPLQITMQPALVLRRYGKKNQFGTYPDLLDVWFMRDGYESKGHFTEGVKPC
jgi:hypothetical protein